MGVLHACMSMHHMCAVSLWRPEKVIRSSGTWDSNPYSLGEQTPLLTSEPALLSDFQYRLGFTHYQKLPTRSLIFFFFKAIITTQLRNRRVKAIKGPSTFPRCVVSGSLGGGDLQLRLSLLSSTIYCLTGSNPGVYR